MAKRIQQFKRYVKYLFQWLFLEKPRGLDFTMRDTSLKVATGGKFKGYAKTDEKHAREIFKSLHVDETMRLLDIGCGKGAFLREASREPFGAIAGVEYVEKLADIARNNFKKLGIADRVKVYTGDAVKFEHYGDYNVFYFSNPFDSEIMDQVMKRIMDVKKNKVWIVYYHPIAAHVVESYGGIAVAKLYDPMKSYKTIIYEIL